MHHGETSAPSSPLQGKRSSVADILLRAANEYPESGMFVATDSHSSASFFVSYTDLVDDARRILGGIRGRASKPGTTVALLLEKPGDFIPALWACFLGGYVPCPLAPIRNDPDRWASHLAHVDKLLLHPLLVSTGELLDEVPQGIGTAELNDLRKADASDLVYHGKPADIAILMLTSGSTGFSKAVQLSNENILSSMAGRAARQQLNSSDIALNWIAFDHVAALLESHMIALYVGAKQVHVQPAAVLADPLCFLRLIHSHRVSLAFAPNFLLSQINTALAASMSPAPLKGSLDVDLSCLRRIVTGGEANLVETGLRFLQMLAPYKMAETVLWPAFGMTETCAAAVYSSEFPRVDIQHEFASVGQPIDGIQIRIVDQAGRPCLEQEAGELQVSGPIVFRAYYNNETATREAFTADGWFRTGDVGYLQEGRLNLVARTKDSIIVNGVNYFSHELEAKIALLDGIDKSFIAAFPTRPKGADTEQVVVMFAPTFSLASDEELYQLLTAIRNTTIMLWGFRPGFILPLQKEAFPKTSLGKIQRSLLRKRFESGHFDNSLDHVRLLTARQMGTFSAPQGELEHSITEVFSTLLAIDASALSATASFFDLGGTSLDIMKLTRALESRCGLKGGLPIVLQNPSVRQLAQLVSAKGLEANREYDPVVPLQTTGRRIPLFCVHPGNGEIFALVNVAKYFLNDRPFYALRAPGFNEGDAYFETYEEMIDKYVSAIRKRQPRGPYAIAGYSFGCSIAFEIVKELERSGDEVAFLGCIDGAPVYELQPLSFNLAAGLALVTDLITLAECQILNSELGPEAPNDEVCRYILKFASQSRMTELNLDFERFAVWARAAHAMERLLYSHLNTGVVNSLTVFRSEGYSPRYVPDWSSTPKWRNELTRWGNFARTVKYIDVPGHHFTIMGPRHVSTFQSILRSEIERACVPASAVPVRG